MWNLLLAPLIGARLEHPVNSLKVFGFQLFCSTVLWNFLEMSYFTELMMAAHYLK
jgi:hypothetical protein